MSGKLIVTTAIIFYSGQTGLTTGPWGSRLKTAFVGGAILVVTVLSRKQNAGMEKKRLVLVSTVFVVVIFEKTFQPQNKWVVLQSSPLRCMCRHYVCATFPQGCFLLQQLDACQLASMAFYGLVRRNKVVIFSQ